jgi:cellulose synthase (UDP-forming)
MLSLDSGITVRCRTIDLARGGASVTVPAGHDFAPKEKVSLSIFTAADELPLPAEVVDQHGAALRLRFARLSLEEEATLVQSIFSRADAWVHWGEGRAPDHPIASFQGLALRGLSNVRQMLKARPPEGVTPLTPRTASTPPPASMPPPAASAPPPRQS